MTGFYSANRKGNILARQEYLCITETVIGKVTGSSGRALQFSSCNARDEMNISSLSNLTWFATSNPYFTACVDQTSSDKEINEWSRTFLKHVRDLNNKKKVLLLDL